MAHDVIDLKVQQFIGLDESGEWDGEDVCIAECSEGFEIMAFRENTGLFSAAIKYDDVQTILSELANAPAEYAVIRYSVQTVQ